MISDADITKLKKAFATKDDLKRFATKDDLKRFATKEELTDVKAELADVKVELGEVHEKVDALTVTVGRIENTLDKVAGAIQDLREESAAGAVTLARHTRQIEALSKGTGVRIPQ
jgi:uncharacterized coiled-coil DUF342 family protein